MATEADARRIALALPGAFEKASYEGQAAFRTKARIFAFLAHEPKGLLVWVDSKEERDALASSEPDKFFTSRHFAGQPAVLIHLDAVDVDELTELITDSWLLRAPRNLTRDWPG
jgi:hypothetical protein